MGVTRIGPADTGWQALELAGGCVAYSTTQAPRWRRVGGVVEVRGAVKPTAEVAAGGSLVIATLPAEARPSTLVDGLMQGSGSNQWLCELSAAGVLNASRYRTGGTAQAMGTSTWLPFHLTYLV